MKPVRAPESIFSTLDPSKYEMEPKMDGWRALVIVENGPKLWTREFRKIEMPDNLESQLRAMEMPEGTVLDGEIWTPEKRGSWAHDKSVQCRLSLWDAIRVGFQDLSNKTLEERQAELDGLMRQCSDIQTVRRENVNLDRYNAMLAEAAKVRGSSRSGFIHGVVLKRRGSPRRDHAIRSVEHADWIKVVFPGMSGWGMR